MPSSTVVSKRARVLPSHRLSCTASPAALTRLLAARCTIPAARSPSSSSSSSAERCGRGCSKKDPGQYFIHVERTMCACVCCACFVSAYTRMFATLHPRETRLQSTVRFARTSLHCLPSYTSFLAPQPSNHQHQHQLLFFFFCMELGFLFPFLLGCRVVCACAVR